MNLSNDWGKHATLHREAILNTIDKEVTDLFISAKKSCRKLRTGDVAYSQELSKLELT